VPCFKSMTVSYALCAPGTPAPCDPTMAGYGARFSTGIHPRMSCFQRLKQACV
jgi:hypothetical protein